MAQQTSLLLDTQHRHDLAERNRWMIRVRWFYVISLPGIATAVTLALGRDKHYIKLYLVLLLAGVGLNTMLWLFGRARGASMGYYRTLALVQVLVDLLLASAVVYSQGGIPSRATVLYAVPIVGAGSLFLHPAAYIAAALSGVAYVFSIVIPGLSNPEINAGDLWVPAIFYPSMFILLAALISRFSAINSRDQQERAYRELLAKLHERLQQPTSAIAAAVEKLEASKGYVDWTIEDKEYLSEVVGENARLHAMIANVLESADETEATTQDDKAVSADLVVLLRDAATNCALSAGRKADLLFGAPDVRVPVYGQPQQLKRALENIIDNAFRYSTRKTQVNVILEYNAEKGHITITVKDRGHGMPKAEQHELFQMFSRLEEQAVAEGSRSYENSLGLGLYVSKVILERHHGKLEIQSEQDKGTTVTVHMQEELWRRKDKTA